MDLQPPLRRMSRRTYNEPSTPSQTKPKEKSSSIMPKPNYPTTMRALVHTQSPQTLAFSPSYPPPAPSTTQYLLQISACALTTGELLWPRPPHLNTSHPGVELTGTILLTPSSNQHPKFQIGDEVYCRVPYPNPGGAREFATAEEKEMALKPRNVGWEEAASVPVAALTAWQGLFVHGGLEPPSPRSPEQNGVRILINGASSATGLWFLQLASAASYHNLTGICSGKNEAIVREMGAEDVVDYTRTPLAEWEPDEKFDLIFDCVGEPSTSLLWSTLDPLGGKLFTIVMPSYLDETPQASMDWSFRLKPPAEMEGDVEGRFYVMEANGEQLQKITALTEAGKVRAVVDSVWELEEFEKAVERVGSGRAVGKVCLRV